jgi:hypothetical protein
VEETYPHPREILTEINALESEIIEGLRELKVLIDSILIETRERLAQRNLLLPNESKE